jgi:asparagine synthase (glutamine-hydrolysing)
MCGILGWVGPSLLEPQVSSAGALRALDALRSRGPDGHRIDRGHEWLLGHTRLAVIDLTDRASQPMTDGNGRWLVYNGEIYNFHELRDELLGHGYRFQSESDSEVLLHAMAHWGVACLERLRGMFAFGLIDTRRRELILARDRYGVKPLLYEVRDGEFRFASNLFALRALPDPDLEIDEEAARLYIALGYVPAPHSIRKAVRKVRPGHYLRVQWSENGTLEVREHGYWSIGSVLAEAPWTGSATEALAHFERLTAQAVRYRLVGDVPIGILLSGGIDSSLITALCREQTPGAVPAFTMGFEEPTYDESPFARAVTERLGGDHTTFCMSDEELLRAWHDLWEVFDEPFADSSALPMIALSRRVVARVKVVLSGDGGDELFCGYNWHARLDGLERLLTGPRPLAPADDAKLAGFLRRHGIPSATKLDRAAQWSLLRTGISDAKEALLPVDGSGPRQPLSQYFRDWSRELQSVADPLEWSCYMDLLTYLPDDLMVKADRATMSVGLELRSPFLDHGLSGWCLRCPIDLRYDRERQMSKILPRSSLGRRLPRELFERPKQGFTPPLDTWLAGALAHVVEDALERLNRGDLAPLRLAPGCETWEECEAALNGEGRRVLWRVVCFSEWLKRNV